MSNGKNRGTSLKKPKLNPGRKNPTDNKGTKPLVPVKKSKRGGIGRP